MRSGGHVFKIGDYAVCPGHGVGQVCDIEEKVVGGETMSFFIIKIISNGMTVMVPTGSVDGIRALVNNNEIAEVYDVLTDHDVSIDNSTWNRRYREYMLKIKTGSLVEIADVLRALFLLRVKKNLSFGEKKMLEQCRNLLSEEISISSGDERNVIDERINACFGNEETQDAQ
jgi:CarD family transcriptional regulator